MTRSSSKVDEHTIQLDVQEGRSLGIDVRNRRPGTGLRYKLKTTDKSAILRECWLNDIEVIDYALSTAEGLVVYAQKRGSAQMSQV